MEDNLYRIEPYPSVLLEGILRKKNLFTPEDIQEIAKVLAVVIVDPYLKIQTIRNRLGDALFIYLIVENRKRPKNTTTQIDRADAIGRRNTIHIDRRIGEKREYETAETDARVKRQKRMEETYFQEIRQNEWVVQEIKKYQGSITEDRNTLYLVLLEKYNLLLPVSLQA